MNNTEKTKNSQKEIDNNKQKNSVDLSGFEPAFLDEKHIDNTIPDFISTTNARELYGMREGESVTEAILRHKNEKG